MPVWSTVTNYDSSAAAYDQLRIPGEAVVNALKSVFENVSPQGQILSLGCGTGQYESSLTMPGHIVGLDQSRQMLNIARERVEICLQANMVELPFQNGLFDGAYFVHSLHHVGGSLDVPDGVRDAMRRQVLAETTRVISSGPLCIIQRDPSQSEAIWFWKYFPEALKTKLVLQPKVSTLMSWFKELGLTSVCATPVDEPMIQGFYDWQALLTPEFRKSFSEFSYMTDDEIEAGVKMLTDSANKGLVEQEIENCKKRFAEIGGATFIVSGIKL